MALRDRLDRHSEGPPASGRGPLSKDAPRPSPQAKPKTVTPERRDAYQQLKSRIHRKLIDALDLSKLDSVERVELQRQVRSIVDGLLSAEGVTLNAQERDRFVIEVLDELLGLGPLEPLLNDPTLSDILVNGANQCYVERAGRLELTDTVFKDDAHLLQIIDRIVSRVGRRIDEACPMVDARLPDGSRVNAIIPPLAIDGPALSIRCFSKDPLKVPDLIGFGTLTQPMATLLEACVKARLNIIISGGTGSGKTTLLNVLSGFIPENERIVTIEDSAELQLYQPHVVRLETRPANIEGRGEVAQRDLVKNCLRMRPDRIVVGEVRSGEALDMLQAMNTGHDGSLATLHANSPRDALIRLETMIAMAGVKLPDKAVRQQISSAVDLVIQASRLSDGSRKLTSITEVLGMEGEVISMQDIFVFERRGVDANGKVVGEAAATGVQPTFVDRLRACGIELPPDIFDRRSVA